MSSALKKNEMADGGAIGPGSGSENTHTSTLTVEIPIIPISKIGQNESETAIESTATAATAVATAAGGGGGGGGGGSTAESNALKLSSSASSTPSPARMSATPSTDTTLTIPQTSTLPVGMNMEKNNNNHSAAEQQAGAAASTTITMTIGNKGKMDTDPMLINFKVLYALTQLCGITMIVLMGSWIGVHMGGLDDSDNPKLEFNWHPLLMTIGLIFLYGNSILVYRGFRRIRKKTLKLAHASIHMVTFILTVIALKAVFDSHNLLPNPIPNMYSLHSWLGLSAVILFCLQYVAGFIAFLAPGASESWRIALMPLHVYFGLCGFVLAIASALMGLTEKAIFSVANYSNLPSSGVMVNMCGVFFVIFGVLVLYLATNTNYKRKPIPEDTMLLTGANE